MKILLLIWNLLVTALLIAFSFFYFFNELSFIRSIFILATSFAFGIAIFNHRPYLNKIHLIFLILISIVAVQNIWIKDQGYLSICFLISIYFLYIFFYSFIQQNSVQQQQYLILVIYLILILLEFFLFGLVQNSSASITFPNTSIFSILLSSHLAFILPCFFNKNNSSINKAGFALLTMIAVFVLLKTNGRAGWLGLLSALLFIGYIMNKKLKKRWLLLASVVSIGFAVSMFMYKSASSNGRLLIYKVVLSQTSPKDLVAGIGYGQFKVKYNLLQAGYFNYHDINNKDAILADNTFFAFNDFFQFVVETGLAGLIVLVSIFYLLVHFIITKKNMIAVNYILLGACSSLISIIIAALFSYPLQIPVIIIQGIFCIAIISYYGFNTCEIFKRKYILNRSVLRAMGIVASLLIFQFGFKYLKYNIGAKEAFDLSRSGFRMKSVEKYKEITGSIIKEGYILYQYASELYKINEIKKSLIIIGEAKKYYSDIELYNLLAEIEYELKNYEQAENNYKVAIQMLPKRMRTRHNLFEFYINIKDTANAIYWGKSILYMPVKVPSEITNNLQLQTTTMLNSLINLPNK